MSATDEIFKTIADLQRIRFRLEKLNRRFKLDRVYPGNYTHIQGCIHEASSNLADFWIAFSEPIVEDL